MRSMNDKSDQFDSISSVIRSHLGKPAYERPGVMLYQTDCLDAMGRLPTDLIDLTVTSPPYNIGKEYEEIATVDAYIDWCSRWLAEIARISKTTASFWLNLGYLQVPGRAKCLPISYLLWDKVPLFFHQEIVWNYGAGVASRRQFSPRNEKFLWYVSDPSSFVFNLDEVRDPNVKYPNQKKNGKLKCNPMGKNPTDVWSFPKVTSGANRASAERTPHPAQFPVSVIDRIVRACSHKNQVIMDPFLGSGTTAEVGLATGRFTLGFEIETKYLEIAANRMERFAEWRDSYGSQQVLPILKEQPKLAPLDFG